MHLPADFIDKMQTLLQNQAADFFNSYEQEKTNSLRVNTLKISVAQFKDLIPFPLKPVAFCPTGFYYDGDQQPGKHPLHQAGLYYIQEASAMLPAQILAPQRHEKVLDLCAAPGGKSTYLAALMNNTGLLVANEIHHKRVKSLAENIERLGITNCLVTNESPEHLAQMFPGYFDKILVDAPCSGEGMFRKDPEAVNYWSNQHVQRCAAMQAAILESAYTMLRPGGTLVYSTCTFSPEENEQTIENFLSNHADMRLLPIEKQHGIKAGVVEWTKHNTTTIANAARLWPHHLKGEGHFVAKLHKLGESFTRELTQPQSNITPEQWQLFHRFCSDFLNIDFNREQIIAVKNQLHLLPEYCPPLTGLKVLRCGLHLGELKKNRFEPNHALAMALKQNQARYRLELPLDGDEWKKYLRGETLPSEQDRGWLLLTLAGFPIGWGKEVKGVVKNFYPKGLRIPGL